MSTPVAIATSRMPVITFHVSGLALFDAFASTEKTLHANAGRHKEVPWYEVDSAVRFFARHLG